MSAEILREAAALMRERASAATHSPWVAVEGASASWWVELPSLGDVALDLHGENARHIASWHPAVALAVADWLDRDAEGWELLSVAGIPDMDSFATALTVARTYLGRDQ